MNPTEQEIRFCTSIDGVRIAYATTGVGPPLVKAANWLSHLEFDWNSPVWRHWLTELSRNHTLVRYDERACGLSDWDVEDFSLEAWVRDLEAVVEVLKLQRFPLLGISQGGPIAIAYAVRNPGKVSHLILYGSYARGRNLRNLSPQELEEREVLLRMVKVGWGKEHAAFRQVFTSLFIPEGTVEHTQWFNELQRISTSPENAQQIMQGFDKIDVRELASHINIPTLVLHAKDDLRIPFAEGRLLASLIPAARFVPLEGRNHILLENETAWPRFLMEIRNFLGVEAPEQPTLKMGAATSAREVSNTDSVSWHKVTALFEQAIALPSGERNRLLDEVGRSDPRLRQEVESLISRHTESGGLSKIENLLANSIASWGEAVDYFDGKRISHYLVLDKIGAGGMGSVVKARDLRLNRLVALKLLPPYFSQDKDTKQRFILEARAAAALDHPNVCTIYEVAEEAGQLYLAMPCYDGETLKEKIQNGPLSLPEVLSYAMQVAEGLAHAHESGVIHRDIKPANIMVTTTDVVKILDFGIARMADSNLTRTGIVIGTIAYMSPEQSRGEVVDHRSDLWSLGVLIYEMLAGKQPFSASSDQALITAIQRRKPGSLRRLRPDIPKELVTIIRELMEKNPENRPATAVDVTKALRQL